ncbi:MAG: hypothetical protein WC720_05585 [Candidatus Shapirobacteria bacterium]|jgi:hypothetical protein
MNIILNNQKYDFSESDLPIMVHGKENSGASFFSIALIANLFLSGHKILFFTAFPMAKESFSKIIGEKKSEVGFIENNSDFDQVAHKQAIIVKSGDMELFKKMVNKLDDIKERIIFIKNIEEYDESIFELVKEKIKIVISGDIDKCCFLNKFEQKEFITKIYFSKSENSLDMVIPDLDKYNGYLISEKNVGVVKIKI